MKEVNNCRECGLKLNVFDVRGDRVEGHIFDSGGGFWAPLKDPYSEKNGDPNMVRILRCPKYKRRWWGENNHDIIAVVDSELVYGVRLLDKKM